MTKITMEGKYTSNGRPVRILCTDANYPYSVVGLIELPEGNRLERWTADGLELEGETSDCDLIPAKPEPVVEWGYLSSEGTFYPCADKERAIWGSSVSPGKRLAKRVTTTEVVEP